MKRLATSGAGGRPRTPDRTPEPTPTEAPQAALERQLMEEFLHEKGYLLADLRALPESEATELMAAASQYASLRMAEVEATARFREKIHRTE